MKYLLFCSMLMLYFSTLSQEKAFDYVIKIEGEKTLLLNGEEVTQRTLKKRFEKFDGAVPQIQLEFDRNVEWDQVEKIKKQVNKQFINSVITFKTNDQPVKKNYEYYITGTIEDQNNHPLKQINVIAKGTRTGLVTDANGHFRIGISKDAESIIVDHKDFRKFEMSIDQISRLKNTDNLVITLASR